MRNYKFKPRESVFWSWVDKTSSSCWLWTGYLDKDGYGRYSWNHRSHQLAYELVVGEVPQGLELDHLCRNRRCVNPDHLEPVTQLENQRRSPISSAARTHCPKGHPYNESNTRIYNGGRVCRACDRLRSLRNASACKRGHPLSGENTCYDRLGRHHCRQCKREALARRVAATGPINLRGQINP